MASLVAKLALFVAIFIVVTVFAFMGHYASIQARVKKESRCLRAKLESNKGGVYDITAINDQNTNLYTLTYNKKTKTVEHKCTCPPGDTVNHFKNIRYYDQKERRDSEIKDLMCSCDGAYDTDDIFFKGYPGLVRYMQSSDRSFFETDFTNLAFNRPAPATTKTVDKPTYAEVKVWGKHVTTGSNALPLLKIKYDLSKVVSKSTEQPYSISCECPNTGYGMTSNLSNIFVYSGGDTYTAVAPSCTCDAQVWSGLNPMALSNNDYRTFTGSTGLSNFMANNGSKRTFFTDLQSAT